MHELEIRGVVRGKSAVSGGEGSLAIAVRFLAVIESRFLGGNFEGGKTPALWSLQTVRKIASTLCFDKCPVLFELSQCLRENFFGPLFIASPRPYRQLGQGVAFELRYQLSNDSP
jgi:hypothetical protein